MAEGMRPSGSPKRLEQRRRKAVALLRAGQTYQKVASLVQSSVSSVVRWSQAYRRGGRKALQPKPTPGRPPRLSEAQVATLERVLGAGAMQAGYSTELWTLKRISEVIESRFGVAYRLPSVRWMLMRRLHWSWQKPERRAIQRDEPAIAHWKRTVWPDIKKRPAAARSPGLPRRKRVSGHADGAKNVGPDRPHADPAAELPP